MNSSKFESFFQRISEATGISSQTKLASTLGINRSAITQAKRNDSIPDRWILRLSRIFGLNPDWIEKGIGEKLVKIDDETEFGKIPKVKARLSAGGGSFEVEDEIEGLYSFKKDWLRSKGNSGKMVLMDIFGNSMEPELKDGDTVLVDQSQKDIMAGAIYAVGIDDTVMVKRLEKHPNKLVLLSDNKDYSPIYLQGDETDNVRIIGKVIWICREIR
ncbi:MAG: helix-turn-helix domain-containing protein [Deltaproteobacteria bacterium]|nr:helix-turn-helix domain-containing protein [Deltaproteobacteria bacterium]